MAEGIIAVVAEAGAKVMAEDAIQLMKRRKRRRILKNHPFNATIVKKYGHFSYECRIPKREREDRAYVANSAPNLVQTPQAPAPAATSSLLMAIEEA